MKYDDIVVINKFLYIFFFVVYFKFDCVVHSHFPNATLRKRDSTINGSIGTLKQRNSWFKFCFFFSF